MDNIKQYVALMLDTLTKKVETLQNIEIIAINQNKLLTSDKIVPEDIIKQLEEKDVYIAKLDSLDEGFETIYERAHEEITANKQEYKEQLQQMQQLIKQIAEITVKLQVYEQKNKPLFDNLFTNKRAEVKTFRKSSATASSYYKNMSTTHQDWQTYFLDEKK